MEDKTKDMMDLFEKAKNAPVDYSINNITALVGATGAAGAAAAVGSFFNLSNIVIMVGSIFTAIALAVVLNTNGEKTDVMSEAPIIVKQEMIAKEQALQEMPARILIEENELKAALPITDQSNLVEEIIEVEPVVADEVMAMVVTELEESNVPGKGLQAFHSVHLNIGVDIKLVQGLKPGVSFENNPELADVLEINVSNDVLYIGIKNGRNRDYRRLANNNSLKIILTMNAIENLVINGSGGIYSKDAIESDKLSIQINGSGDVELEKIVPNQLNIAVNGSGDVGLYGNGNLQKGVININGSGDVCTKSIDISTLSININGSGDANVTCQDELKVYILGSGDVCHAGAANVLAKEIGSGQVHKCSH